MKGTCPNCKELVRINARSPLIPYKSNPRAMDYYPEPHPGPDGQPCDGYKKAIL